MLNLDHDKKLGDLAVHLRISLGSSLYAVAVHPRVHCPVCHCPRIPQHAAPPQPQRKVQEKMQAMAQVVTPVALLLCGLPLLMGRTMGLPLVTMPL